MLKIHQIDKTYRGRRQKVVALQHVSLELPGGKLAVLQGPSGCGKTTLLLAAGGLLAPDNGQVVIDGTNLYQLTPAARDTMRANKVGFVFQQFHLIPYLNVLDNLMAPALALDKAKAHSISQRARALAAQFGLLPRVRHFPDELSTGERQRTALARAMINEPTLLLVDEPTGNLDKANAEIVMSALNEYAATGAAVLIASHDARVTAGAALSWQMSNGQLVTA